MGCAAFLSLFAPFFGQIVLFVIIFLYFRPGNYTVQKYGEKLVAAWRTSVGK